MKSVRGLGNASLVVAVGGFAAVEAAMGLKWVSGPVWKVLGQAFEAATVGGVADWFAATALFREVPLPVIRRHTNIVVRSRRRIVSGIAHMVQNRWLSLEVIRDHLDRFSASQQLIDYLSDETQTANLLSFLRSLFTKMVREPASGRRRAPSRGDANPRVISGNRGPTKTPFQEVKKARFRSIEKFMAELTVSAGI
jgi:uncharacterized membrane-anchored protein YjiN (DUF445 family)